MNTFYKASLRASVLGSGLALVMAMIPSAAVAQTAPADEAADSSVTAPGDIIVTARKRQETLLDTPVAVSALTSEELAKRNVVTITDLAANTPGMNINNNSSGRNDRSFQSIILRGVTPGTINLTTTSTFIDGAPVASASALNVIGNPARVEVLKGPQSAYFGRQTFAGAVNIVTKDPGASIEGSVSVLAAERNWYDVRADITAPLAGDMLGVTASALYFTRDGSYKNAANPGETLGDQSTYSINGAVVFRPTDNLKFKLYALYSHDDDGPSADGLLPFYDLNNFQGQRILSSRSNCTLQGYSTAAGNFASITARPRITNNYICGRVPSLTPGSLAANTAADPIVTNFLAAGLGRVVNPEDGADDYGFVRGYFHSHLSIDYTLPGTDITLTSLTGVNDEYFSLFDDLDNFDGRNLVIPVTPTAPRGFYNFPFLTERNNKDFSQEIRATSGQRQSFRWTIGASYLDTEEQTAGGGGAGLLVPVLSNTAGKNTTKTYATFFGLAYDLGDWVTLNVEGRYSIDKVATFAGPSQNTITAPDTGALVPVNGKIVGRTFKNFQPRVIVQVKPTADLMVYASYARGVNPARFNNTVYLLPLNLQPIARQAGIDVVVKPEKLDNYELGIKGRLFDNRLTFALAAYYAKRTDQITTTSVNFIVTDPGTGNLTPRVISGLLNGSNTTLKGVELDASLRLLDNLDLYFSGAINDSHIKRFNSFTVSTLTGVTDFRGNELPNASKYSYNVGAQYRFFLDEASDTSVYVRGDYAYKSGLWANAANIAKTAPQKILNFKAGVEYQGFTLEGFVNNVTNNKAYTSIAEASLFSPAFSFFASGSAFNLGLPQLRTFGTRLRYDF